MDPKALELIQSEIKGIEQALMPLLDKQAEEIKRHGETATTTSKAIKDLEAKYDERLKNMDEVRQELADLKNDLGERLAPKAGKGAKSAGELFTTSEQYEQALKANTDATSPVEVKRFTRTKDLLTGASLGQVDAFLYPAQRESSIITSPDPDLHIRDLLPVTPTTAGIIEYVVRTGGRWVAGTQVGTDDEENVITEGALKKEQALNFDIKQAGPVTIAHWIPVTRQVIRRADQLRRYIDNELIVGLRLAEDEQLLYGDGSAGNVQGLMTNAAVQDYAASGKGEAGDTRIDTIRRAITLLRLDYYRATGLILHPNDWEEIELQKDDEARYLWVTVSDGGVPRLWRVPVVETPAIEEGDFLVGDFSMGANLWDLEQARINTGWVNDDFVRNRLVVLGEEDIIFTTEHPRAFVRGGFTTDDGGDGEGGGG